MCQSCLAIHAAGVGQQQHVARSHYVPRPRAAKVRSSVCAPSRPWPNTPAPGLFRSVNSSPEVRPLSSAPLIETAKLNAVNPHAWLTDTLEKIVGVWPQSRIADLKEI